MKTKMKNKKEIANIWTAAAAALLFLALASLACGLEIKAGTSEDLTIFLRNSTSRMPIESAGCSIDIWHPDNTKIVDDGKMSELGEGFYYFSTNPEWTDAGNYRAMARCEVGSYRYYAATMFKVVETTSEEWFRTINDTVSNTYDYLEETVYPSVQEIENNMQAVLGNQSKSWDKLIEMQGKISENYDEIIETQDAIKAVNGSISGELAANIGLLEEMNSKISSILGNITREVVPKISQLEVEIALIKAYTESIEAKQGTSIEGISELRAFAQKTEDSLALLNESLGMLSGEATGNLAGIEESIEGISLSIDEIREMLDCANPSGLSGQEEGICGSLAKIKVVAEDANLTSHSIKGYLEGEITGFLVDINSTLKNSFELLVGINSSAGSIQWDVQNLASKWGSLNAEELYIMSAEITSKIDAVNLWLERLNNTEKARNQEVLERIGVIEALANAVRAELGFNEAGETAYSYLVRLETNLAELNTTVLNKIEFEAGKTRIQISRAIEGNMTSLLEKVSQNSNSLAGVMIGLGNLQNSTTESIEGLKDSVSETRNMLVQLEGWMSAINDSEQQRYEEAQGWLNSIIELIKRNNNTESARHELTQQKIDNALAEIELTKVIVEEIMVELEFTDSLAEINDNILELIEALAGVAWTTSELSDIDYVVLYEGANLIALPKQPSDISIQSVMSNISGKFERVDCYNSASKEWLVYNPDAPFGNTLHSMEKNKAYWVYATGPATLYIS